jgi:hypothetical protein
MPPRSITAVILVFWLAVSGWALWRTVGPYFQTGEPPPYGIDLAEESSVDAIGWDILQNGVNIGSAETNVRQDETGLFKLECNYKLNLARGLLTARVINNYRVTRDGDLRSVGAQVKLGPTMLNDAIKAEIEGPVQAGKFQPTGAIDMMGQLQKVTFEPVDVQGKGSVLNPLHPVNRITGLRPGRSWQVPLFDPVELIASAKLEGKSDPALATVLAWLQSNSSAPRFRKVTAVVLSETQTLAWNRAKQACLVIEYTEGELSAHTWVRERDGLVLQQEAKLRGDTLLLRRMPRQP